MPVIYNSYPFLEDAKSPPSPSPQYANDNGRITRSLRIEDGSETARFAAAKALLGVQTLNTASGGGGAISRWINRSTPRTATNPGGMLPASYPAQIDPDLNPNGNPYLWCTNIPQVEMLGASEGIDVQQLPIYSGGARFHAEFNTVPYFIIPDNQILAASGPLVGRPDEGVALASGWQNSRFVSRYLKPGSRTITLPLGFMYNARLVDASGYDNAATKQGLAFRESIWTIKYTHHTVPLAAVPFPAMDICLGCVNANDFDFVKLGTLLLSDVELKQYYSALGQILVDTTYSMRYLPHFDGPVSTYHGWNSYLVGELTTPGDKSTRRMRWDWFTSNGLAPSTTYTPATGLINVTNLAFPYFSFESLFRPPQVPGP